MAMTTRNVSVSPGAVMKAGKECGAAGLTDAVKFNSHARVGERLRQKHLFGVFLHWQD
jgi:hypothetical protein